MVDANDGFVQGIGQALATVTPTKRAQKTWIMGDCKIVNFLKSHPLCFKDSEIRG